MLRICTICARGGSKGVPNKNIRPLLGKPLIAHSIEQARASGLFAALAVSSDSDAILAAAAAAGVEHLVKRPDAMASDQAAKLPAIQHCVKSVEEKTGQPAMNVFKQALNNAKPVLEVKSRRVGGATYQVPVEVRPERRNALAMKWLITFSRQRGDKTMADRLASELIAASRNEGNTIKKKDDTHRMAEANKAFAHYRW